MALLTCTVDGDGLCMPCRASRVRLSKHRLTLTCRQSLYSLILHSFFFVKVQHMAYSNAALFSSICLLVCMSTCVVVNEVGPSARSCTCALPNEAGLAKGAWSSNMCEKLQKVGPRPLPSKCSCKSACNCSRTVGAYILVVLLDHSLIVV